MNGSIVIFFSVKMLLHEGNVGLVSHECFSSLMAQYIQICT